MTTWNYERLKLLVDEEMPQERFDLEFKPCDELRWGQGTFSRTNSGYPKSRDEVIEELSRDVSAMANAAGGIIIYGILENHNASIAEHLDPKPFKPQEKKQRGPEWLDEVIRNNISPSPVVKIITVFIANDHSQGWYYVLDIQQSVTALQAKDKRFYKRINTTRAIMEQYEIVDVMNRAKSPILEGRITYKSGESIVHQSDAEGSMKHFDTLEIIVALTSINTLSAEYGSLSLCVIAPLLANPLPSRFTGFHRTEVSIGSYTEEAIATGIYVNWSAHQNVGVYSGSWTTYLDRLKLHIPSLEVVSAPLYLIQLEISGPNTPSRISWYSVIPVSESDGQWQIQPLGTNLRDEEVQAFWRTYHATLSYSYNFIPPT